MRQRTSTEDAGSMAISRKIKAGFSDEAVQFGREGYRFRATVKPGASGPPRIMAPKFRMALIALHHAKQLLTVQSAQCNQL